MVENMKNGAVAIDVSIDMGGCFETSEVTTHNHPTFEKHGVIHYCVPNIPARFSKTASVSISNMKWLVFNQYQGMCETNAGLCFTECAVARRRFACLPERTVRD